MIVRRWLALLFVCCYVLALPLAAQQVNPGGFQIAGTVVNASNGLPLSHTSVTINLAGGNFSRTVTTGDDGRFAFAGLRAGKYALSALRRGFAAQGYEQHEGSFSTAIVVGRDLDASNLTFRVWPDASFSGRISDDHNDPVRNARVMLLRELMVEGRMGKRIVANTSTDDQGHYHFGHLKPGAYYIAVSARPWYAQPPFMGRMGFQSGTAVGIGSGTSEATGFENRALDVAYPLTFYPDVSDAASASPITLQPGNRASADIMLRAVPALHVRIRNATGEEEQQQFVSAVLSQMIFDGIEIPLPTTMRGMGGNTSLLTGMAPGRYLLRDAERAALPPHGTARRRGFRAATGARA